MYKPVLLSAPPYYVSYADMVKFITQNSDMEWNNVCNFVREHSILQDEGPTYYDRDSFIDLDEEDIITNGYNKEQTKWLTTFFEAHPFVKKVMFVFD